MSAAVPRPSLTRQLVVPIAFLALGLTTAAIALGWWQMTRQLERQLQQRASIVVRTLRFTAESANSREEMSRLNRMLAAGGDVEIAAVVGGEPPRIMIGGRSRWRGRLLHELPTDEIDPRMVAALQDGREFAALDRPRAQFYFVGPLSVDRPAPLRGAQLLLVLNTGPLQGQIAESLRLTFLGLAALVALGLGGFAWLVHGRVIQPLGALAEAFGRERPANAPALVAQDAAREIATLAAALAEAFGQVQELNRDLEARVRDRTAELVASLDRERELGRLQANFIGMVSHEYRNAVATILSSAQILDRYPERLGPGERGRHLAQIAASCGRLASLVEEVLLYSRSESGRLAVNLAPVDLDALCRAEAEEATRSAGVEPGRVVFEGDDTAGGAVSDEQLWHHVLSNLLGNALKYSPAGGDVRLELRRKGERAVVTVRDCGIGIPADELPRIGEAFHRGKNASAYPGTGLGLVMVRRCLDLLGGTLRLESRTGEGTMATVTVPAYRGAPVGVRP